MLNLCRHVCAKRYIHTTRGYSLWINCLRIYRKNNLQFKTVTYIWNVLYLILNAVARNVRYYVKYTRYKDSWQHESSRRQAC